METLQKIGIWYRQTATLAGYPVVFFAILICLFRLTFTFTCLTAGYQCEGSIGTQQAMAHYMSELVGGSADMEIKPRK